MINSYAARAITLLLSTVFLTIAVSVFSGCSDGIYEPRYDEPVDTMVTHESQAAYSGQNFFILWDSDSIEASYVTLSLYRDNSFLERIKSSVFNEGEYQWQVPDYLSFTDNYRILVMSTSDSDNYLYTPFIAIRPYTQIDGYEPDNSPDRATPLSPDSMAQMHAMSTGDVDWFRFEATASVNYAIRIFTSTSTRLELFTVDGDSSVMEEVVHTVKKLIWQCDSSGTYRFKVSAYSSVDLYSYQIMLTEYTSPIHGLVITWPDSGAVLTPGGSDSILWQSPESTGRVSIVLVTDSMVHIKSIRSSVSNDGKHFWDVPAGLDTSRGYRIRISDAEFASVTSFSGVFSLALRPDEAEPDNMPDQATVLSSDTSLDDRTITAGDLDWFAFDAEAEKTYQITTTGSTDMRLVLYDRDSATVLKCNDDGTYGKNAQITWTCASDGRYFVAAQGFTGATTGVYGLRTAEGSMPTLSVDAPAPSCTTGTRKYINWDKSGYTGGLLLIELLHDTTVRSITITGDNAGPYLWEISQEIPGGDDYRIRLTGTPDSAVTAVSQPFQIVSIADEYEPDNLMEQADTSLVFGTSQEHTLPKNDTDWVAFQMVAGHSYTIGVSGITSVYISVHRADSSRIASDSKSGSGDDDVKIRCLCVNPGRYYVQVRRHSSSGGTDRYSLVIFEDL